MSEVLSSAPVAAPTAAEHWLVQRTRTMSRDVAFTHMQDRALQMFVGGVLSICSSGPGDRMKEIRDLIKALLVAEAVIAQWIDEAQAAGQEESK